MELFAGFGGLTQAIKDVGGRVVEPQDTMYGQDLGTDEGFIAALEEPADWKHMAPPCRTFTKARRKDHHGHAKRLRTATHPEGRGDAETTEANLLADRCASIAEDQDEKGLFFSIENPLESFIWELKSMKRIAQRKGVMLTRLDQCAYGGPHHKPTGLLHNAPWLKKGKRCSEAPAHKHTKLEGRVWSYKQDQEVWFTSEAAEYPSGLCERWAADWQEWSKQRPESREKKDRFVKMGKYQNKLVREELMTDKDHS